MDSDRSEHGSKFVALQQQILDASMQNDFDKAMTAFQSMIAKNYIHATVICTLTSNLLQWARFQQQSANPAQKADADTRDRYSGYAQDLEQKFRDGTLAPSAAAHAYLLQFFTATQAWDVGMRFWKWLESQEGKPYVSPGVYGSAIAMLAAQDTKLEDLEALYEQGLSRFPDGFSAYHFSHGAIIPDRERSSKLPALPVGLLLAIMNARVTRGDSQNAYLALDSLLRLRPAGLDQFFYQAFLQQRPISEAYTVFAMACKAGVPTTVKSFRDLIVSLRKSADLNDARSYALVVKTMLSATYLHLGAGGRFTGNVLTELVIVLTGMVRMRGCSLLPESRRIELVDAVQELIAKLSAIGARFGVNPTIAAFNSIITNVGGLAKVEEVTTAALKEAHVMGLQATDVTRRSLLVAAGSARDTDLVAQAWKWMVDTRAKEGQYPNATDLHILIRACVQTDTGDLAQKVIDEMTHLQDWEIENALTRLHKKTDLPNTSMPPADSDAILAALAEIKADLEVMDERTSNASGVQDFSVHHPPMLLFSPPKEVLLPEAEMRKLYDELTTDPNAPKTEGVTEPPTVAHNTKVPFAQLRYESWKHITYLLAEAKRHDDAYVTAVDEAIANGTRPPQRKYGEVFQGEEKIKGVGLSDPPQEFLADGEEVDVEKVRANIMELRKVAVPKA